MDDAEMILNGALENHYKMINEFKGVPGVLPEKLAEGMQVIFLVKNVDCGGFSGQKFGLWRIFGSIMWTVEDFRVNNVDYGGFSGQ